MAGWLLMTWNSLADLMVVVKRRTMDMSSLAGGAASDRPVFSIPLLATLAASLILLSIAHWGGLADVVNRWISEEEYGHGFFIPLITLWLLWHRREALVASVGAPVWSGPVLVAVSTGMLLLGALGAMFLLMQLGFLVGLMGVVLCLGGVSLLRVALLPIAFLVFAIPLPYFLEAQLTWRLQLISSQIGVEFLRLFGTSVYLQGNIIDLGIYKLQVVEACSGLRYLYPLLSVGFLIAYMYRAPLWQRTVLFLSAIPITVLMNSLRIAVVGLLVERWGTDMADGFLHYFEGWAIFMACLLVLLAEIWVFERFAGKRRLLDAIGAPAVKAERPLRVHNETVGRPLLVAVLLLGMAAAAVQFVGGREAVRPERKSFAAFPLVLGEWRGQVSFWPAAIENVLGADDYLLVDYHHPDGGLVNLFVAYYATQRNGESPHSPQVCIPGDGWMISSLERVQVAPAGIEPFKVNRVVISRGGQRQLVYYWFAQRGRRIASEYWNKAYLLYGAIFHNRTDGALVRLTTPIVPGEAQAAADGRLRSFLQRAVQKLASYVPH